MPHGILNITFVSFQKRQFMGYDLTQVKQVHEKSGDSSEGETQDIPLP